MIILLQKKGHFKQTRALKASKVDQRRPKIVDDNNESNLDIIRCDSLPINIKTVHLTKNRHCDSYFKGCQRRQQAAKITI